MPNETANSKPRVNKPLGREDKPFLPPYEALRAEVTTQIPINRLEGDTRPALDLPAHTFCPEPLSKPRRVKKFPPDPPISEAADALMGEFLGGKIMINPIIATQLSSVRPESKDRIYVDWFATVESRLFRRTGNQKPFISTWDNSHWSWLHPPPTQTKQAVKKFFLDQARGTVIVNTAQGEEMYESLYEFASLVFKLPQNKNTFLAQTSGFCEGPALTQCNFAFVIDSSTSPPTSRECFELSLPEDWKNFKYGRCPFRVQRWKKAMEYHPSNKIVTEVLRGMSWGVSYDYEGTRLSSRTCKNLKSENKFAEDLIAAREKQYQKGLRSGPFVVSDNELPLFNFMASPTGGVVKTFSEKVRPINDFGYPYDESSINDNIGEEKIQNSKFETAAQVLAKMGKNTLMCTIDVKGAFNLIPVALSDLHLNGELHQDKDGKLMAAFLSNLIFGSKSAPRKWNTFGAAIEFMTRMHTDLDAIIRYCDDFLIFIRPLPNGEPDWQKATKVFEQVMRIWIWLGVPFGDHTKPTRRVQWLGIELCSETLRSYVSDQRRQHVLKELEHWKERKSCTRRQLESLIGALFFITQVVTWGKAFLGRLIRASCTVKGHDHKICLSRKCPGFKLDIAWWLEYLPDWGGCSVLTCMEWTSPTGIIEAETDASEEGHGCYWDGHWYGVAWTDQQFLAAIRDGRKRLRLDKSSRSMPYLELYAIAVACATFGKKWSGHKVRIWCDCKPAQDALTKRYSKSPESQSLIRIIAGMSLQYNFDIQVEHIEGIKNVRADLLSHLNFYDFMMQAPLADYSQTIPSELIAPICEQEE
jgi:hypothetical protein